VDHFPQSLTVPGQSDLPALTGERLEVDQRAYEPRLPGDSVLYQVVLEHLESFLAEANRDGESGGLPAFVERAFRRFLGCGHLANGFARLKCSQCHTERLVPFSCKSRLCSSCGGRRMAERAAHLVDAVLPQVPIRQWVLSLPFRLRYALAWNHDLCRAVLGEFAAALLGFYTERAAARGILHGQAGAVTAIQRAGGSLNLNIHFHTLAMDGVFTEEAGGLLTFHPAAPPTDTEVAELVVAVRERVLTLLGARGLLPEEGTEPPPDPLAEASPLLARICSAGVQHLVAMGERAGRRLRKVGVDPDSLRPTSRISGQAAVDGFNLHAHYPVPEHDRERLERLCRYVLRPPVQADRLRWRPDGRIDLYLKRPWSDGTIRLVFEPMELLEKIATLIPRPHINLIIYHGVLAPNARLRDRVVRYGAELPGTGSDAQCDSASTHARYYAWAELMKRAFAIDVLRCPRCGGRLKLIATIADPAVIRKILEHLKLEARPPEPQPARSPPD
jgi:hypothetical protein